MTQIIKLLLVVIVTLHHIELSMASLRQMTNDVEDIYVQTGRANKGVVSKFNEDSSNERSNDDRIYSNEVMINRQKIGWHGTSKDQDETKIFSRGYNNGDSWRPFRSILEDERTENDDRLKGFIEFFISKNLLPRKQIANITPDTVDDISLADPFSSAAEESKLLDQNSFENTKCGIIPLALIALVDHSSFGTFSQIIFGGISMIVKKYEKALG